MSVSLPKEILIQIFKFFNREETTLARKSLKLTSKPWYNAIISIYGSGLSVRLRKNKLYKFHEDLILTPSLGYKFERLYYFSTTYGAKNSRNMPQHVVLQAVIKACPYLVELSIYVSTVYSHLRAIRYRTLPMKSVERLHVYNLQGYSLTANRFYIDLCMKLKETLTLFEILSTATFDAVIKYYGSIYYFIRKLPNLQNLRIVINAYAPIIAYPDVSLSTLLDESKGLKTIELEGFSLIQCDKKSLTDDNNKNNSLRQLKIRTWSLQFSVLKFIMSRCNKLDYLSIHTCVDTKIDDDDDETDSSSGIETLLQEFSHFLENIKTVYVDFRIDGHQVGAFWFK